MSKRQKIAIGIISVIVLAIITGVVIEYCIELKHQNEQQMEHQRLMEESIQEIHYINENSYFGEIELMGEPLEDYIPGDHHYCKPVGEYLCWKFNNEEITINLIEIYYDKGNCLGITVGDSYDKAIKMMEDRGYSFEGQQDCILDEGIGTAYVYKKAYVTIAFATYNSNTIRKIAIQIRNPYYAKRYDIEVRNDVPWYVKTIGFSFP